MNYTPQGWTQEIAGIYKRGQATVYRDNHGKWHARTVVQYRAVSGAPADSFETAVMNLYVRLTVTAEETRRAAQELSP